MKNGADKVDDVIGSSKNLRNMPIRGMNRRQNYRPYEPPQFNSYDAKDEVQKARSKALSGANLALASGGIAAGAWYFSGEHTSWYLTALITRPVCGSELNPEISKPLKHGFYQNARFP